MPLYGTFDTMQLADLLQWISSARISGTLSVSIDPDETYMTFERGDLVAVGSGDPLRLDLAQILLHRGHIDSDQIDSASSLVQGGNSVLDILIETGAVDEKLASEIQQENAFDTVLDLFFQEDGHFYFSEKEALFGEIAPVEGRHTSRLKEPLSTQGLLMEEMRRLDEWTRIRDVFPNSYVIVKAADGGPEDNQVYRDLKRIGQSIATGALFQHLGGSRFDLYRQLHELHAQGFVVIDQMKVSGPKSSDTADVDGLIENAKFLLAEEQFDEAREILFTAASLAPDNQDARVLLGEIRKGQLEHLYSQIPPTKVVCLSISREKLLEQNLTARESYLALRLNGRWDVNTLIKATPLGELEILRVLRKLLHARIAQFL